MCFWYYLHWTHRTCCFLSIQFNKIHIQWSMMMLYSSHRVLSERPNLRIGAKSTVTNIQIRSFNAPGISVEHTYICISHDVLYLTIEWMRMKMCTFRTAMSRCLECNVVFATSTSSRDYTSQHWSVVPQLPRIMLWEYNDNIIWCIISNSFDVRTQFEHFGRQ